jgi:hypothetical protein
MKMLRDQELHQLIHHLKFNKGQEWLVQEIHLQMESITRPKIQDRVLPIRNGTQLHKVNSQKSQEKKANNHLSPIIQLSKMELNFQTKPKNLNHQQKNQNIK